MGEVARVTCGPYKTYFAPSGASLRVGAFQPKKESMGQFKREKNWGFVEEDGALMIYYALLPCTVVLEFDMGQPDGVVLRSRACYTGQATVIEQQTGQLERFTADTPIHVIFVACWLAWFLTHHRLW